MKDLLLVLFYQAIVAVNTAVILSGIIWLAKRKDEKDGRKPNPEFTPPPKKKIPSPQANQCDDCRYRKQLCHKTGIRKCSNYIKAERSETDFINAKCGDCKRYANGLYGGYCILRNEPANPHERRRCYFFKKYEAPVRTTHICKNCKHYLATEEGAATGLCGMKDEITFGNNYSDCFEKREEKDHE